MEWFRLYRQVVRHMLPQSRPYADMLERFVLASHMSVTPWTREARMMLKGFSQTSVADLAMLARMTERGSMTLLPAHGLADLVTTAVQIDGRGRAIRAIGYDRVEGMSVDPQDLVKRIARDVVTDVVRACDWLNLATTNARIPAGSRIDMTSGSHRDQVQPICEMALALVLDVLDVPAVASSLRWRRAA